MASASGTEGAAEPVRCIIHADMDAFFASVEQRDRPELRGRPVLVGGSPRARGVVAAASYEAREFGCRSAMPMRTAVRLCPQAEIVRPDHARYRRESDRIMDVLRRASPIIEPLSMDEAFVDVTQRVADGADGRALAEWIKRRVREETRLTVSCGVATGKSVAKIASDFEKPDGLTVVPPGTEAAFLAPLPIEAIWGIGPRTASQLRAAGVATAGELAERPLSWLIARFGVRGEIFHQLARGIDDREVGGERETKSISSETTFAEDVSDYAELRRKLLEQASQVGKRLRGAGLRARTVQLKLRLADFTTFTRQRTLGAATDDGEEIGRTADEILRAECLPARRFRLIGVGVSNLSSEGAAAQLGLFDEPGAPAAESAESAARARTRDAAAKARAAALEATLSDLRDRFGGSAVQFAGDDETGS